MPGLPVQFVLGEVPHPARFAAEISDATVDRLREGDLPHHLGLVALDGVGLGLHGCDHRERRQGNVVHRPVGECHGILRPAFGDLLTSEASCDVTQESVVAGLLRRPDTESEGAP